MFLSVVTSENRVSKRIAWKVCFVKVNVYELVFVLHSAVFNLLLIVKDLQYISSVSCSRASGVHTMYQQKQHMQIASLMRLQNKLN